MQSEQTQSTRDASTELLSGVETAEKATLSTSVPAAENPANDNSLMVFFAVGLVVNIVLIAAYVVWAMGQWKKKSPGSGDR